MQKFQLGQSVVYTHNREQIPSVVSWHDGENYYLSPTDNKLGRPRYYIASEDKIQPENLPTDITRFSNLKVKKAIDQNEPLHTVGEHVTRINGIQEDYGLIGAVNVKEDPNGVYEVWWQERDDPISEATYHKASDNDLTFTNNFHEDCEAPRFAPNQTVVTKYGSSAKVVEVRLINANESEGEYQVVYKCSDNNTYRGDEIKPEGESFKPKPIYQEKPADRSTGMHSILGKDLKVGDEIYYSTMNGLKKGRIFKITPKTNHTNNPNYVDFGEMPIVFEDGRDTIVYAEGKVRLAVGEDYKYFKLSQQKLPDGYGPFEIEYDPSLETNVPPVGVEVGSDQTVYDPKTKKSFKVKVISENWPWFVVETIGGFLRKPRQLKVHITNLLGTPDEQRPVEFERPDESTYRNFANAREYFKKSMYEIGEDGLPTIFPNNEPKEELIPGRTLPGVQLNRPIQPEPLDDSKYYLTPKWNPGDTINWETDYGFLEGIVERVDRALRHGEYIGYDVVTRRYSEIANEGENPSYIYSRAPEKECRLVRSGNPGPKFKIGAKVSIRGGWTEDGQPSRPFTITGISVELVDRGKKGILSTGEFTYYFEPMDDPNLELPDYEFEEDALMPPGRGNTHYFKQSASMNRRKLLQTLGVGAAQAAVGKIPGVDETPKIKPLRVTPSLMKKFESLLYHEDLTGDAIDYDILEGESIDIDTVLEDLSEKLSPFDPEIVTAFDAYQGTGDKTARQTLTNKLLGSLLTNSSLLKKLGNSRSGNCLSWMLCSMKNPDAFGSQSTKKRLTEISPDIEATLEKVVMSDETLKDAYEEFAEEFSEPVVAKTITKALTRDDVKYLLRNDKSVPETTDPKLVAEIRDELRRQKIENEFITRTYKEQESWKDSRTSERGRVNSPEPLDAPISFGRKREHWMAVSAKEVFNKQSAGLNRRKLLQTLGLGVAQAATGKIPGLEETAAKPIKLTRPLKKAIEAAFAYSSNLYHEMFSGVSDDYNTLEDTDALNDMFELWENPPAQILALKEAYDKPKSTDVDWSSFSQRKEALLKASVQALMQDPKVLKFLLTDTPLMDLITYELAEDEPLLEGARDIFTTLAEFGLSKENLEAYWKADSVLASALARESGSFNPSTVKVPDRYDIERAIIYDKPIPPGADPELVEEIRVKVEPQRQEEQNTRYRVRREEESEQWARTPVEQPKWNQPKSPEPIHAPNILPRKREHWMAKTIPARRFFAQEAVPVAPPMDSASEQIEQGTAKISGTLAQQTAQLNSMVKQFATELWGLELPDADSMKIVHTLVTSMSNAIADIPAQKILDSIDSWQKGQETAAEESAKAQLPQAQKTSGVKIYPARQIYGVDRKQSLTPARLLFGSVLWDEENHPKEEKTDSGNVLKIPKDKDSKYTEEPKPVKKNVQTVDCT